MGRQVAWIGRQGGEQAGAGGAASPQGPAESPRGIAGRAGAPTARRFADGPASMVHSLLEDTLPATVLVTLY